MNLYFNSEPLFDENELEKMQKYADYKSVTVKEIPFRSPNESELPIVKEFRSKLNLLLILITAAFALLTAISLTTSINSPIQTNAVGRVLMITLTLIALYFLISNMKRENLVCVGKVINKYKKLGTTREAPGMKHKYDYYVAAIVDEDKKYIAKNIKVSKKIYETINDYEPILIIATGTDMHGVI